MPKPAQAEPEGEGLRKRFGRMTRRIAKWCAYLAFACVLVILIWFSSALYNRLVRFPREEKAWVALRAQRQPTSTPGPWHEFRGILHAHSKLSHDCQVPFEEILQVLKSTGLDFICLSDHCVDGKGDFDWQWRGIHDGKLFIPGFEMRDGFMPFGASPGTVLSNQTDSATLARQIIDGGGVLFYAHPEEPRDWGRPELTGMEIYNIHTDFKGYRGGRLWLLPQFLLNQRRYPDHFYRLIFNRPTEFLRHWDQLNASRHLTGIAGNDCHQNVGLKLLCTGSDELRLEDTSPKYRKTIKLNWFTRLAARVICGPLKPGTELYHVEVVPYERIARFVNTHILARALSEPEILESLRAGRVFIGFDHIADSSGFSWWAQEGTNTAVMGESAKFSTQTSLHARSPIPCRFTVIRDGQPVYQARGRAMYWTPPGPGKYRVEAELEVLNEWTPWVYANPIQLRE